MTPKAYWDFPNNVGRQRVICSVAVDRGADETTWAKRGPLMASPRHAQHPNDMINDPDAI